MRLRGTARARESEAAEKPGHRATPKFSYGDSPRAGKCADPQNFRPATIAPDDRFA